MSSQSLDKINFREQNSLEISVKSIEKLTTRFTPQESGIQLKMKGYSIEGVLLCLLEDYGYEHVKNELMRLRTVREERETDYGRMLHFFNETLSGENKELLEWCSEDTVKDASFRKDFYSLPDYTNKGIYIITGGFILFFNDDEKYIGYSKNSPKAFIKEDVCSLFVIKKD